MEKWNDRLEIEGDAREDVERYEADLAEQDAIGEAHYLDWCKREGIEPEPMPLPAGWENAPLSAQVAFLVAGDDAEMFDEIKAYLKGE